VVTTTTVPGATTTTVLPGTPRPQTLAPADPAQAQPTSAQAADDGGLASTGGSIAALATVAILLTAGGALIHRRLNR
jgi:hypothetical protein